MTTLGAVGLEEWPRSYNMGRNNRGRRSILPNGKFLHWLEFPILPKSHVDAPTLQRIFVPPTLIFPKTFSIPYVGLFFTSQMQQTTDSSSFCNF
jgi:hypothetical protein